MAWLTAQCWPHRVGCRLHIHTQIPFSRGRVYFLQPLTTEAKGCLLEFGPQHITLFSQVYPRIALISMLLWNLCHHVQPAGFTDSLISRGRSGRQMCWRRLSWSWQILGHAWGSSAEWRTVGWHAAVQRQRSHLPLIWRPSCLFCRTSLVLHLLNIEKLGSLYCRRFRLILSTWHTT